MPDFLRGDDELEDDEGEELTRMKRRTRKQYEVRVDLDDMDGIDDVRMTPCLLLRRINDLFFLLLLFEPRKCH
jgi:hypothetical protein